MSYTDVFGGSTIYPSQVSYLAVALSAANITLEWPLESDAPEYPAARILDVTSANSRSITLPDATLAGPGETILFNNLPASSTSFTVKDAAGATVATVAVGTAWQLYLAGNATAAGTWRAYQMGASTATVNAADLAGYGLTVTSGELSQAMPVEEFTVSPYTLAVTDRAKLIVWAGSGAGEIDLPSAATAGDNFFVAVRNDSEGMLTFTPAGSDLVDGDTSLVLQPGDSATLATDGADWFSVGLGQQPIFAFDYTLIDLTGAGTTYTLTGNELNRIAYSFTGTLSNNVNIVVPSNYQQYWVANNTTGAYTLSLSTDGGTPANINQNARAIMYCNGANVITADSGASISIPLPASQGGTGQTSYAVGDLLYASGVTTLDKLADVATGNALLSGGVGVAPAWGKVGLTTHVSGTLPVANGGTNLSSYAVGDILYASGTTTVAKLADVATGNVLLSGGVGAAPAYGKVGLTTHVSGTLPVANGGTGITALGTGVATALGVNVGTAGAFVTSGGALGTPSSGTLTNCTGVNVATVSGTLPVANGGTGQTTYTNGQLLIGNTTGNTLTKATLTQGTGITITNGTGSITIASSILGFTEANNSLSGGTGAGGTAGSRNVSIGQQAGAGLTTGSDDNVAVGYAALDAATSSSTANVAVGSGAGGAVTTGDSGTYVGYSAGLGITTGGSNVAVGYSAMSNSGTATTQVVAVGYQAGKYLTGASNKSVAIGYNALSSSSNTGVYNVAIGDSAGATITTGKNNVLVGTTVAPALTSGQDNHVIGYNCLAGVTTGARNVICGSNIFSGNASAALSDTVAIGYGIQPSNVSNVGKNVIIGAYACGANASSADGGVFIGYQAGYSVPGIGNSVMIGYQAGYQITGPNGPNTIIGGSAGASMTAGSNNTLVGQNCGFSLTTGDGNVFVGGYTGSAGLAYNVVLATGTGTRRFWHDATDAYVSHNTTASAANAYLDSATSKLQRSTSSLRYKRDVEDLWSAEADKLLKLKPVFYRSKCDADPAEFSYYGVIAEQAHELGLQRLVQYEYAPEDYGEPDDNNERWPKPDAVKVPGGFAYDRMTVLLLDLVQRQQARIEALEARVGA